MWFILIVYVNRTIVITRPKNLQLLMFLYHYFLCSYGPHIEINIVLKFQLWTIETPKFNQFMFLNQMNTKLK
jgi:hypothetical protein